jgi:hypothetical protein
MMAAQFAILRDVIWSPSRAVTTAAEEKNFWIVKGLVLAMAGLSTALANQFMVQVAINGASSYNAARTLASTSSITGYLAVAVSIAGQILSWHVTAALLLCLNYLMPCTEVPYRGHLSLAVLASLIANLAPFHLLIVWHARGAEAFESIHELFVPMGLNLLPIKMSPLVWNLLGHFSPYELSSAAFLVFGFSTLTHMRLKVGFAALGSIWLVWTLVRAALFKLP